MKCCWQKSKLNTGSNVNFYFQFNSVKIKRKKHLRKFKKMHTMRYNNFG